MDKPHEQKSFFFIPFHLIYLFHPITLKIKEDSHVTFKAINYF